MERHRRTLVKAITWRLVAVLITIAVVYIFRKDVKESVAISFTANGLNTVLYYLHERLWNRLAFGKK